MVTICFVSTTPFVVCLSFNVVFIIVIKYYTYFWIFTTFMFEAVGTNVFWEYVCLNMSGWVWFSRVNYWTTAWHPKLWHHLWHQFHLALHYVLKFIMKSNILQENIIPSSLNKLWVVQWHEQKWKVKTCYKNMAQSTKLCAMYMGWLLVKWRDI